MSEEIAPIPEGALPAILEELMDKILIDADIAWIYLKQNPIAVVALSKAKIELAKKEKSIEEDYNYKQFFKKFDNQANQIYGVSRIIDEQGLALTTELLVEIWRKNNQEVKIQSINKHLLKNLLEIHDQTLKLENTPENRVIREMVFDSLKRISDLDEYEKKKANDNWSVISTLIKEVVEKSFKEPPKDDIPRVWMAWFGLSTLNNTNAEEYRSGIASLVLEQIKAIFPDLEENLKFKIAPWILALEKIIQTQSKNEEIS